MLRTTFQLCVRRLTSVGLMRMVNSELKCVPLLNQSLCRHFQNGNYVNSVNKVLPKPAKDDVNNLLSNIESQCKFAGYLKYEQLTQLLTYLDELTGAHNVELPAEQIKFLLVTSGTLMPTQTKLQRLELFNKLWQYLKEHNLLTIEHYRVYLQVLNHNRSTIENVQEFLNEISKVDDREAKSGDLLTSMLDVVCATGNMRQAAEILAVIRANNLPLTEHNFASLLLGNALNGDSQGIVNVKDSMIAAGVPISCETQTMLACGYLEHSDETKAMEILTQFHRQFDGEQILQMLRSTVLHASPTSVDVIVKLINELPENYTSGTEIIATLQNICIELIYQQKLPIVKTILKTLPPPLFNENQDVDTFGVRILHETFRAQINIDEIIDLAQMLVDSSKNTRALHIISEVALRRNAPLVIPIFKALAKHEQLRPHYFWPLFTYNFRRHGENGILRTLKLMNDYNVECDQNTLQQYVLPRLSIILEDPQESIKLLSTAGLSPSNILIPIIKHLLSQRKLVDALKLVNVYPTKLKLTDLVSPMTNLAVNVRATKQYFQYAKLFEALLSKTNSTNEKEDFIGHVLVDALTTQKRLRSDPVAVKRLIKEFNKLELKLSYDAAELAGNIIKEESWEANAFNETMQLLQKMRSRNCVFSSALPGKSGSETSSFIKHPRDMTVDELECHLIELESKQLNTRGVLRRLLQLCVRDGRLERALEVKAKCDLLHVQVSPGMLASIFDMYIKLKDLQEAQVTLTKIQEQFPGFQLDEHKLIDYAALLVQNEKFDSAKELLHDHASKNRVQGGDYALKNTWNLLNNVAVKASQLPELPENRNMTSEMFTLLNRFGYCKSQNAVLGPIVRERLLRNQVELAVDEFCNLAERYKCTPLQYELLSLLVSLSHSNDSSDVNSKISTDCAQELLSRVCEVVKKVYGIQNLNSALVLAFAESGTDGQLRRLLMNPEFRINHDLLMKNCENLSNESAVRTLLRLARNSRGVTRVIDEQRIYNMLLQHCVESNNYTAALDLYERLNTDDELKISQEFLRQLVKLLRINKVEIPNNIALRAQFIATD